MFYDSGVWAVLFRIYASPYDHNGSPKSYLNLLISSMHTLARPCTLSLAERTRLFLRSRSSSSDRRLARSFAPLSGSFDVNPDAICLWTLSILSSSMWSVSVASEHGSPGRACCCSPPPPRLPGTTTTSAAACSLSDSSSFQGMSRGFLSIAGSSATLSRGNRRFGAVAPMTPPGKLQDHENKRENFWIYIFF